MPTRAPRSCPRPGCGGVVHNGVCSRCGALRRWADADHEMRRGSSRERGYDTIWEKLRRAHLAAEPLCRMCAQMGRVTPAVLVDHIVPLRDGGARLDDANLQSLCRACHDKKSAQDVAARRAAGRG